MMERHASICVFDLSERSRNLFYRSAMREKRYPLSFSVCQFKKHPIHREQAHLDLNVGDPSAT